MREGGLDSPTRHPLRWQEEAFYDEEALDAELRRVFDICHGCRRCFNLCDSFPRLFDLIDESESGELDTVASTAFKPVVDACTLCDMCFMVKCPYVPPHEFDLDFPHLMLRYRAVERRKGIVDQRAEQLGETDRNGRMAAPVAGLANWASDRANALTRPAIEALAGVHREVELPRYAGKPFTAQARALPAPPASDAPAHGRQAVLYATCFVNHNEPELGHAARAVLAANGVATDVVYPRCCGMPKLERGNIAAVAEAARAVAAELKAPVAAGKDIIALTPSCALMLKFEWPLICPDDPDVKALAEATFDITEYIVDIAKKEGLAPGLKPLDGGVALHLACHARAQNMGAKAAEMLALIPDADIDVIERCSGHGGTFGVMKETYPVALKVGRNAARQALRKQPAHIVSECPLAAKHLLQGMEVLEAEKEEGERTRLPARATHPVMLLAMAYGLVPQLAEGNPT